jgi:hypothetical protein
MQFSPISVYGNKDMKIILICTVDIKNCTLGGFSRRVQLHERLSVDFKTEDGFEILPT